MTHVSNKAKVVAMQIVIDDYKKRGKDYATPCARWTAAAKWLSEQTTEIKHASEFEGFSDDMRAALVKKGICPK